VVLRSLVNWLLWWRVSDAEVDQQVRFYDKLKLLQSARGLAMVLLLAAALVMSLVIFFGGQNALDYIDVGLFGILAVLIYEAYRWAMLAAMVVWTADKVWSVIDPGGATMIVVAILWWAAYMRVFWLAFRTESRRAALGLASADRS
jgi:hypothetical protein